MSEKILEMADKTYEEVRQYMSGHVSDQFCIAFAELIVRECIAVLDEDDGATHHAKLLEEHFGFGELKPCRSPYCECDVDKCTHPGFYDARGEE